MHHSEAENLKNILGRRHCPSLDPCPIGKGTPPPKPHPLGACGASTLGPSALDMCPLFENPGSAPDL